MATENLFLLEFLVDKICLKPSIEQDRYSGMCPENCVTFEFLNNGPLDVCEADFAPKRDYTQSGAFKSGKSILFSLTPEQAEKAVKDFKIHVNVFKKLPNNKMPDRIPIGQTDIQIVNQFNELLKQIKDVSPTQTAGAKVIKDSFDLTDSTGTTVGSICIFIRISCFGKLIVTQFQMNLEDKSVVFKDNQGSSMYRYRKSQKWKNQDRCEEWDRAMGRYKTTDPCTSECTDPCMPYENTTPFTPCSPQLSLPPPPDDRCYQEIGAEMNGNALTIRVLKDKKKKEIETEDLCCCDQNRPGGIGECGDSPAITALPEGPNPPSLNFKVNNCCGGNQDLKVNGPKQDGPLQVTEMCDPHRDVFVLRIGKKAEGSEKKSNLELELRTPKGLDRKPPPKYESRDTQYDEYDCGPPPKKGGKQKGKKKKKK